MNTTAITACRTRKSFSVLLIGALGLLSAGASCKEKKPPKEPDYCTKYPDMCEPITAAKDYFLFKPGSWWVYEEETTHERDSVYVVEYANDPASANFETTVYSQREDFYYNFFPIFSSGPSCSTDGLSGSKCIYIKRAKMKPGNLVGEHICFFIQYKKEAYTAVPNIYHQNNRITVIDIWDDYSLGSLNFDRTIRIFEDHTGTENHSPTNHYFSSGVGLIRKEIIDSNQVWNLVSYHIEP